MTDRLTVDYTGQFGCRSERPRPLAPSSSGLGLRPFTPATRVRVPLGSLDACALHCGPRSMPLQNRGFLLRFTIIPSSVWWFRDFSRKAQVKVWTAIAADKRRCSQANADFVCYLHALERLRRLLPAMRALLDLGISTLQRSAATLAHPGIVAVHTVGYSQRGRSQRQVGLGADRASQQTMT